MRTFVLALGLLFVSAIALAADPPLVPLDKVGDHLGEEAIVELTVNSSRALDGGKYCFLNSKKNFQDKDNFTVVIRERGLKNFAEKGIKSPAEHFHGKKIRVTGKIMLFREKHQIEVDDPAKIALVIELKE